MTFFTMADGYLLKAIMINVERLTTMSDSSCLICDRIAQIHTQTNPSFVAETSTGYIVLGDYQFFRGYTLLLCKYHVPELHDLDHATKVAFLTEMSLVAEVIYHVFQPRKLNYECLGNAEPHLHWHIFPRSHHDPSPGTSSWKVDRAIRYDERYRLTHEECNLLKKQLLVGLRQQTRLTLLQTWDDV